jgi:hypothetical protein
MDGMLALSMKIGLVDGNGISVNTIGASSKAGRKAAGKAKGRT